MSTGIRIENLPEAPTHALRMIDNWCGDSDISFLFAFVVDGAFYDFETGKAGVAVRGRRGVAGLAADDSCDVRAVR
ncbi:hypothetical protein [Pseudomonas syringae]|uniref:hypothetical protein n=1 Tax=Pseudomonas syringae TaxID=317 RepID=UPI002249916D|nr:hypothetical protein [Pseudomonas syringae]UZS69118.1 hypothetical protein OQB65_07150 [Pseudomonas syringae]